MGRTRLPENRKTTTSGLPMRSAAQGEESSKGG
jgi:hypothetical protein